MVVWYNFVCCCWKTIFVGGEVFLHPMVMLLVMAYPSKKGNFPCTLRLKNWYFENKLVAVELFCKIILKTGFKFLLIKENLPSKDKEIKIQSSMSV